MARPCISAPLTPFSHPGSRMTLLPWRGRRINWSRSTASSSSLRGYLCSSLLQRSGVSCPAVAAAVISSFVCRLNIRSVINMQLPGEHAHCGPSLDPESGFTYSPQIFMDSDSEICLFTDVSQHYSQNQVKSALAYVAWYGDTGIISNIRVCAYLCICSIFLQLWDARLWSVVPCSHHWWSEGFGLCSERRAGGRTLPCWSGQDRCCCLSGEITRMLSCDFTMCVCVFAISLSGVLIACYLVYTLRLSPSEAVQYVRIKRPRSIQTRAQINQVFGFARLLCTQLVQYPDLSLRHGAPFTLQHYLNRQALLLHGREGRALRYTPKVRSWHFIAFSTNTAGRAAERSLPTCRWCTSFACGSPAWPWGFLLPQRSTQSWRRGQLWRLWTGWWGRPWWQNITCPC